jgi:hypothetical protein
VSLLFAEAALGSKWDPSDPHTAGLLTFVSGLTRVGRFRVTAIRTQSSFAYTFLPELDGMQAVGFRWLRRLSPCTPWIGLSVRSSWLTLQKATSFG